MTADLEGSPRGGRHTTFRQLIVFGGVGIMVAVVYASTMALAVDRVGASPTLGAVLAFTVGTIASYVGNALFSFQARLTRSNFGRFLVVVMAGLALNAAMAHTLAARGWHHLAISLTILLTVPLLNFAGHRYWTFR